MADLKETDEPVEKAGKVTWRGKLVSRAQRRNQAENSARAKLGFKGVKANTKMSPSTYAMHRRISGRNHIKKSADPLDTLYSEIEKARGLMPRGGTSRMEGALQRQRRKGNARWSVDEKRNARAGKALGYLGTRYRRAKFEQGKGHAHASGWRRGNYK